MRQLDLFGSFIDTPPEEEKPQEKIPELIKNKTISPVSANEEISYSLVGLAEEMLGAETFTNEKKVVEIVEANVLDVERSENELALSSPDKIYQEDAAEFISIAQLQTFTGYLSENETAVEAAAVDPKQKEENESERNGTVIFEDEKITVKIKNKPAVTTADTKTKEKKEPQKRGRKSLEEIESEVDLIEVPEDEVLFQKQYYSISEVAKWFRVNTSLLRFWENEFDVLKPKKNRKGDRLFRPEDVKSLQLIYQLLRQRKYTIEGAKEYIKTHRQKADAQLQLTNTLQKFKNFLLDLKANL